ncbi:ABC transporter permease [Propionimicrobium sp. PCR01-08-3]|uniref:FtsX-like permease family protein n=1 Tax=Propionimicrobium sp. PCR01-08-3 TaxID=3052086 RepID=UPI00255C39EC|nr:ABC transporter permease [Propionimicrobium sp. PCR01-08-3]WIY83739.1 ABC transporter permease [Propionimicrobium sp. PCR01-08-3]
MNLKYARNDLRKNKGVNAALLIVLILSAFLMATGAMVAERMFGAVDQLFDQAEPPHFLQMHKGEYDQAALDEFADAHPEITAWLIEDMVGFDSSQLSWQRPATGESGDLSESLIDNLFVVQNDEFDFLLDESGGIPRPDVGEVYVPVSYQQSFGLQTGDDLQVRTETGVQNLTIQGFVRDAQMASSLSSATRFVVSDADFDTLSNAGGGSPEIIVEYLLSDPALASDFQTAYESDDGLPKNGQGVTFEMIRIINVISDGLVAAALVFVSILLIAIALLNVRFVIRGTLADEVREIGAMKAIGLPNATISGLYLSKYSVMTLVACVIGGIGAIFATGALTAKVQVNYAKAPLGVASFVAPIIALAVVFVVVIAICRGVLGSVKRIQVVNALVHGSLLNDAQTARLARRQARRLGRTGLASFKGGDLNRRLALMDLRAEFRQWVLIPVVFALASVLMILPTNLLTTFQSPKFVTYMGAPESDLRVDLQFLGDLDVLRDDVSAAMSEDDRLTDIRVFANRLVETEGDEGWESMRVETGDYSEGTVEFIEGTRPEAGEIALSVLNADKFGLGVGDQMPIRVGETTSQLAVSGIYQDVTSGGYTAKIQGEISGDAVGYVIYADVADGGGASVIADEYGSAFPQASVVAMRAYVDQTLSYVTGAFFSAAAIALIFAVGVAALVTVLYLNLQLARDRHRMGVLSALGFSGAELSAQVRLKTLVSVVAGTALGVIVSATLGEVVVGGALSVAGIGISRLAFIVNPLLVYLGYPLLLIAVGYLGARGVASSLRRGNTSVWLRA